MARVNWMRREKLVWADTHGSMASAKAAAQAYFEKHHQEIGIDRVEVRDDQDKLRFQLPRTLQRA